MIKETFLSDIFPDLKYKPAYQVYKSQNKNRKKEKQQIKHKRRNSQNIHCQISFNPEKTQTQQKYGKYKEKDGRYRLKKQYEN